eukprot:GHVO01026846.1.p1 GENE.GHVO01026846.1~~GHVO01026846.1.p1  ORF type:complete len:153 (+),score=25.94 GHVO01026846.1:116-574(+)
MINSRMALDGKVVLASKDASSSAQDYSYLVAKDMKYHKELEKKSSLLHYLHMGGKTGARKKFDFEGNEISRESDGDEDEDSPAVASTVTAERLASETYAALESTKKSAEGIRKAMEIMELRRNLKEKGQSHRVVAHDPDGNPIYKWKMKRKK